MYREERQKGCLSEEAGSCSAAARENALWIYDDARASGA